MLVTPNGQGTLERRWMICKEEGGERSENLGVFIPLPDTNPCDIDDVNDVCIVLKIGQ